MNALIKTSKHEKIDLEKAAKLWSEGISAAMIAPEFGVTRSALLGFASRNREHFPGRQVGKRSIGFVPGKRVRTPPTEEQKQRKRQKEREKRALQRASRPAIHRRRMEDAAIEAEKFEDGTSRYLRVHPRDEKRLENAKQLHELERCECKWPLNQGGPFLFCAEQTLGAVYCYEHTQRALPLEKRYLA